MKKFVRRPHVITLDLNNVTEFKQAIKKIAKTKVRIKAIFPYTILLSFILKGASNIIYGMLC